MARSDLSTLISVLFGLFTGGHNTSTKSASCGRRMVALTAEVKERRHVSGVQIFVCWLVWSRSVQFKTGMLGGERVDLTQALFGV